jgi:hypothetical protein
MRCLQRSVGLQQAQYAPSLQPACVHPVAKALRLRKSSALFAADEQLEQDLEAELDALDDMVMNRPANKGRDQVRNLDNLTSCTKSCFYARSDSDLNCTNARHCRSKSLALGWMLMWQGERLVVATKLLS